VGEGEGGWAIYISQTTKEEKRATIYAIVEGK
jgi:hypothetical protein